MPVEHWTCWIKAAELGDLFETHTHAFKGPLSGTTQVNRYQKGKTNLDFPEARDSEWQWHQLGHMQICTSLQTDNHASTPPLSFLLARCPSCHPTNSVKALLFETRLLLLETRLVVNCPTKDDVDWTKRWEYNKKRQKLNKTQQCLYCCICLKIWAFPFAVSNSEIFKQNCRGHLPKPFL